MGGEGWGDSFGCLLEGCPAHGGDILAGFDWPTLDFIMACCSEKMAPGGRVGSIRRRRRRGRRSGPKSAASETESFENEMYTRGNFRFRCGVS